MKRLVISPLLRNFAVATTYKDAMPCGQKAYTALDCAGYRVFVIVWLPPFYLVGGCFLLPTDVCFLLFCFFIGCFIGVKNLTVIFAPCITPSTVLRFRFQDSVWCVRHVRFPLTLSYRGNGRVRQQGLSVLMTPLR